MAQIFISLFPEAAPWLLTDRLIDYQPASPNPFHRHLGFFRKEVVTSEWIVDRNFRAGKQVESHCSYSENRNMNLLVYKKSLFQPKYGTETLLFDHLQRMQLGLEVRRNCKLWIYEVDGLIDGQRVIEIDGQFHSLFNCPHRRTYNEYLKERQLKALGVKKILRFTDKEVHALGNREQFELFQKKVQGFLEGGS
jgi:very-short-patch-repair endonuclease